MGKIGDLWVRLGLKSEDYKKGMKEAKNETNSFSQGLGKMKAGAVAVWAAIGTAVISFGKQMIDATNKTGDAWQMFIAKSTAGWRTFMQSLSAWDWENFIGRFREARQAAEELQSALDMSFEISNSIKLQKAAMEDELAALEILARNVSKPYEERAKAAQAYLDKVRPIYDQELALANRLLDAQEGRWLAGTGLSDNAQTRKDLAQFLIDYGKADENKALLDALAFLREYKSAEGTRKRNRMSFDKQVALASQYNANKAIVSDFEKSHGYGTSIFGLAQAYENLRGDADTQPLIDALLAAWNAEAAFDRETKRMQQALSQASAQLQGGETSTSAVERFDLTLPAVAALTGSAQVTTPDLLSHEWLERQKQVGLEAVEWQRKWLDTMAQATQGFEDSIVASVGNGFQAITDMMFGLEEMDMGAVLAAFLSPFADTMKQMGAMIMSEGIAMEAFKKSFSSPAAAIAAGAALMAIGSAVSSGLQSLISNPTGGGSSYGGSSSYKNSHDLNYESTLTIYVEGKVSGSDILLAGSNQQNKWNR